MVEELTEKRKMTKTVKDQLKRRIFQNTFVAFGMILFMGVIDAIYLYGKLEWVSIAMKGLAMLSIILTVGIFEVSYRKDSGKIAMVGMECLVLSCLTLYLPKMYEKLAPKWCIQLAYIPIFCVFYYSMKIIVISFQMRKQYQNNLSDVKEIIKEET